MYIWLLTCYSNLHSPESNTIQYACLCLLKSPPGQCLYHASTGVGNSPASYAPVDEYISTYEAKEPKCICIVPGSSMTGRRPALVLVQHSTPARRCKSVHVDFVPLDAVIYLHGRDCMRNDRWVIMLRIIVDTVATQVADSECLFSPELSYTSL